MARSHRNRENSKADRSGVGQVKWRPALGSTAQNVLAVPQRFSARHSRRSCSHIGMQSDGLLIQANYWFCAPIRTLIEFQDIFHLVDVLLIEVGDAPHFFPATA